ncbi:unnamed protein product [Effrenium voratum]|nr:unnamed protein product [Effrenium voratum]
MVLVASESSGLCRRRPGGEFIYKMLARNPWDVAWEIDDTASHLNGVPQEAWDAVRTAWLRQPPVFEGRPVSMQDLANFMRETLRRDPFWTGGQKVPWVDLRKGGGGTVHSSRKAVILNQRQLAFLVVNSLMGNKLMGVETGLDAAIQRCNKKPDWPGLTQDTLHSLLAFLAVLSRELTNWDGNYLVVATPGPVNENWLSQLQAHTMNHPTLCNTANLEAGDCGLADFMAGGVPQQALTDIAGMDVGGGAQLCHVANSQDESLVIFYPEVLAASIFVGDQQMLPVPLTMLGARRYLNTISGPVYLHMDRLVGVEFLGSVPSTVGL